MVMEPTQIKASFETTTKTEFQSSLASQNQSPDLKKTGPNAPSLASTTVTVALDAQTSFETTSTNSSFEKALSPKTPFSQFRMGLQKLKKSSQISVWKPLESSTDLAPVRLSSSSSATCAMSPMLETQEQSCLSKGESERSPCRLTTSRQRRRSSKGSWMRGVRFTRQRRIFRQ